MALLAAVSLVMASCGRNTRRGVAVRDSGMIGIDAGGEGEGEGEGELDSGRRDAGRPDSGFPMFPDSGPECFSPMTLCPDGCTDTQSDTRNCGFCGFTCTVGWLCSFGECTDPGGPGVEGQLRLVGGSVPNEGRVEIYHDGAWGTVCDDYWDAADAMVACRQLGYGGGTPCSSACFGSGTGEIWLDDTDCAGTETSLASCPNLGWGVHNCSHGEDSGLTCF
jgi:hypothetical protein